MADIFDEISTAPEGGGDVFDQIMPERPESLAGKIGQNFVEGLKAAGKFAGSTALVGGGTAAGTVLGGPILGAAGGYLGLDLARKLGLAEENNPVETALTVAAPLIPSGLRQATRPARPELARFAARGAVAGAEGRMAELPGRVRAPMTTQQAYAPLDQPIEPLPKVGMSNTRSQLQDIIDQIPKTEAPAESPLPGSRIDLSAAPEARAALEESAVAGVRLKPKNAIQKAAVDLSTALEANKGSLDPTEVMPHMRRIGRLTRSANPETSGPAQVLYEKLISDLETSPLPESKLLLQANAVARQNNAAQKLSDTMSKLGTRLNKAGEYEWEPNSLAKLTGTGKNPKLLTKEQQYFRNSFPPEDIKTIDDTLNEVYRARKSLASIPTSKPVTGGTFWMRRVMGEAAGHLIGLPWGSGAMAAEASIQYPRLIAKIATKPWGRALLQKMYADAPPKAGDILKYQLLARIWMANAARQGEE